MLPTREVWINVLFFALGSILLFCIGKLLDEYEYTNTELVYALAIILASIIIASIVGTYAVRLKSGEYISNNRIELEKKMGELNGLVTNLTTASNNFLDQPQQCRECLKVLNGSIEESKRIIPLALGKFHELIIDHDELKRIESNISDDGDIWVLTSAIKLEHTLLKDVILDNLRKKVKYTYMLPKDDVRLRTEFERLANIWRRDSGLTVDEAKEQIKCVLVPNHFVYMTVIIYNPIYHPGDAPIVLVKFPTNEIYEEKKYPFVFKVAKEPESGWKLFVDSLQELNHVETKCRQAKPHTIKFNEVNDTRGGR